MNQHHVRALDMWAANLAAHRAAAIAATSEEVYERYMRYLPSCSRCVTDMEAEQVVKAGGLSGAAEPVGADGEEVIFDDDHAEMAA